MKSPTARTFGLRGGLWIGGIALLVLAPLAYLAPTLGALGLAAGALAAAAILHRRASALTLSHEKLSGEIDVLSQHLLKVEALARAAAERARAIPTTPVSASPPTDAERQALATGLEEVTAEIGMLSGIVRELATVVSTQDGELARLTGQLHDTKTRTERIEAEVRRADQAQAARPDPVPVPAVQPVPSLSATPIRPSVLPGFRPPEIEPVASDRSRETALVEAFDGDGLEIWLQPIVTLPQRKVVSYEAMARLRIGPRDGQRDGEGTVLSPETFMPVLERHGRTTALDRRMLKSVATIARHLNGRGSAAAVAYGLSPLSLFEPGFLRSLAGLVGDGADLAGKLVVALPQASWRSLDAEQATLLAGLRETIGFMLDRPTDLRFDARALAERGVGQIKVPASLLLRSSSPDLLPEIALQDLVTALGRSGLRLVACDVERETDVPDLIDLDVPLAQGGVFANPRAVRADVVSAVSAAPSPVRPAEAAAATVSPPEPEPEPPPQRRGFRDFLRRAV